MSPIGHWKAITIFMRIKVTKRPKGFVASASPASTGGRFVEVKSPVSALTLMHHLCECGCEQYDVAVAILKADPEAFEGVSGLDFGLE